MIKKKTLKLLQKHKVDPLRVFIFVADEDEYTRYRTAIGNEWHNIVIGQPTLWKQRNFITQFFMEGTHIVSGHLFLTSFYMLYLVVLIFLFSLSCETWCYYISGPFQAYLYARLW